jgi:hypothetical protein
LIVTLDGYGSGLAGSINIGRGGKIERVHGLEYPHSLGTFYESVTSALGFKPSRHEGKIVGLAAYGEPEVLGDILRRRFVQSNGGFRIVETNNVYFARLLASQFPKIDVAAAYQRVLEEVAVAYVSQYIKKTGLRNLVLSGGVVANVKLNQRLREIEGVDGIFVHQNMGDGGCGTGAALAEWATAGAKRRHINDVYFGPEFTENEIVDALKRAQLTFTHYQPIEPKVAMLLAAGKVVARFDGRHGVRAARAGQPIDPLPRQGTGREPVAQPAAGAHGVHAIRTSDALRAPRRQLHSHEGRRVRRAIHDADLRLHRVDEARLSGGRSRGRHGAPATRLSRGQPEVPPHPDGVLQADRHCVGDQHQLQHARGTHRLQSGRRRAGVSAGQPGLPGDWGLSGRAPQEIVRTGELGLGNWVTG